MLAHQTSRAIGNPGERYATPQARRSQPVFRGIPDGIDVQVSGPLVLVGQDTPGRSHREAGVDRQLVVGAHAESEHDEVGGDYAAILEDDSAGLAVGFTDRGETGPRDEFHPVAEQFAAKRFGHLRVERRKDLPATFDEGHRQAAFLELFGDFQADEASADHRDLLDGRQLGEDAIHVLDVAERMDARGAHAGDIGEEWGGAGGEDQLVVGLRVLGAGLMVADPDRLGRPVDGEGFMAHPYLDVEAFLEHLRLGHQELGAILDDAPEVVGESAVRERHISVLLEHDDAGLLVHAAGTGGGGGASGDATDDENLGGGGHEIIWRNENGCSRGSSGSPHGPRGSGQCDRYARRRPVRGRGGASGAG